jgi:hypothetical protein
MNKILLGKVFCVDVGINGGWNVSNDCREEVEENEEIFLEVDHLC